eukprot:9161972-Pyramimonas_sp.AAC.1
MLADPFRNRETTLRGREGNSGSDGNVIGGGPWMHEGADNFDNNGHLIENTCRKGRVNPI